MSSLFRSLTPRLLMNPAPRRDDPAHHCTEADERPLADDRPHVDRRVDPRLHVVPHDHAQLPSPRVHVLPLVRHAHVLLVEPKVRDLRPGPEVAALPEDGVADVVQMGDVAPIHDDRVLHLGPVPDLAAVPDVGARPDEAIRADLRVLANHRRPLDVRARVHLRPLADALLAEEPGALLDLALDLPLQPREVDLVRAPEAPGTRGA